MAAPSPINESTDLVTFEILSNGTSISDTYMIHSINVEHDANRIPTARLVLIEGNPEKENSSVNGSSTFAPGAEIEVMAGYDSKNQTIFKGIVVRQGLKVGPNHGTMLEVTCQDKAVKMTVGRKNAYFTNTKDSDVISGLISNSGLPADVDSTSEELKELVQYYSTDWDFMISRAEINGMIVSISEGIVSVKKPDVRSSPVLTITYGQDMLDFDAELDARTQLSSIESKAWDYQNQQVISADEGNTMAGAGDLPCSALAEVLGVTSFDLQSTTPLEQGQLKSWANAQMTKSELSKIRGTVKFTGSSLVGVGKMITLAGLGEQFNGNVFVSGVVHDIIEGNWVTEVVLGLSHEWFQEEFDINGPPAAGLLPAVSGLQNGTVKKIYEDPDGQVRVLVNVPMISPDGEGVWARLSNLYATNNAGTFFYPEVGDEVILGFLNEDPRYPVILGSLYSIDKKSPPYTPDEKNSKKAIVSKEQLKVTFDDENKVLGLETPEGNRLSLSDQDHGITIKDQNGNSIKMSSSGIEIKSCAAMSLKASEGVQVSGATGVTISSESELSLSGMSVKADANMELSLSGGMAAYLEGGTEVSINGAMVMIN